MKFEVHFKGGEQAHLRLQEAQEKTGFDYFKLLDYKILQLKEKKHTGEIRIELKDPTGKAPTITETLVFEQSPETIQEQVIMMKQEYCLQDFKAIVKKWLYIDDDEILDIICAGMVSEKVDGDPLWIFLIAPSGGSKTELLRCFSGEYAYHLSDMTSKTLISGLMVGEGKNRVKVKDLLPELDEKILIFKDFTTILEKGRDERREIISQFREAYDGSFSKKVGTLDNAIRYESRFGLVAGVTPVIDKHWKVMQQLGERFLKVRWVENADNVTRRARENEGKEIEMRKELSENANKFIEGLSRKTITFNDDLFGDYVSHIAKFIALGRTPIATSSQGAEFYHDYIPAPEMPTRLVKQLKKLSKCLALVRGKKEVTQEELKTVLRVAKDTIPPDRRALIEAVFMLQNSTLRGCQRSQIGKIVKLAETSIRKILEQLEVLELITVENVKDNSLGYELEVCFYKVNAIWGNIFGRGVQEISEGNPLGNISETKA